MVYWHYYGFVWVMSIVCCIKIENYTSIKLKILKSITFRGQALSLCTGKKVPSPWGPSDKARFRNLMDLVFLIVC
jgi:hypothetical protein